MKLSGLICALPKWMGGGHKRGVRVHFHFDGREVSTEARVFQCPRCGHETRYKPKARKPQASDGNNGSPADGSMSFREAV